MVASKVHASSAPQALTSASAAPSKIIACCNMQHAMRKLGARSSMHSKAVSYAIYLSSAGTGCCGSASKGLAMQECEWRQQWALVATHGACVQYHRQKSTAHAGLHAHQGQHVEYAGARAAPGTAKPYLTS